MSRDIFGAESMANDIKFFFVLDKYVPNDRHQLLQVITQFKCNFKQINTLNLPGSFGNLWKDLANVTGVQK